MSQQEPSGFILWLCLFWDVTPISVQGVRQTWCDRRMQNQTRTVKKPNIMGDFHIHCVTVRHTVGIRVRRKQTEVFIDL